MIHAILIWSLAAALAAAGVANAAGTPSARRSFARWGYPGWWCYLTGGLELLAAVLIAVPACRAAGLALGTLVVVAAVLTVLRHREPSHLAPLGVFAALLALVLFPL